MSPEEAMAKCTGIIIHGDVLAKKYLEEEELGLDEDHPDKGAFI